MPTAIEDLTNELSRLDQNKRVRNKRFPKPMIGSFVILASKEIVRLILKTGCEATRKMIIMFYSK